MSFTKASRFLLPLSIVAMLASVALFFVPGPEMSIEFTGGTLMELDLADDKTANDLAAAIATFENGALEPDIAQTRTGSFFVRVPTIDNARHTALTDHIEATLGEMRELQYVTIGPTVGESLKRRSMWALLAASAAIIVYLAAAFRKIPKEYSPWAFGLCAIAALVHDIVITMGIFTIIGRYTTFQVDTLFVTALLSIMGYSVSDTIVIFDRVRDNLNEAGKRAGDFGDMVDLSLRQSFTRTINTGLGALIMLCALFFFGSESIRWFMLALIVGTVIGTYSSYFIATPLLVMWKKRFGKHSR